MLQTN